MIRLYAHDIQMLPSQIQIRTYIYINMITGVSSKNPKGGRHDPAAPHTNCTFN